jgi:N-acetylneuraminate synthase
VDLESPVYFIADIAANHDGDLARAKKLIWSARDSGADCVKFQHFLAEKIVSDYGFKRMGGQQSHQSNWKQSVFKVYKHYEFHRQWNSELAEEAQKAGIDFMTSPYDFAAVDEIDRFVPGYKIGSGDITWIEILQYVARKNKPVILATGASTMQDIDRAVGELCAINHQIALLQCNTNYTAERENFKNINLNVLKTLAVKYPGMVLGLSDHTLGHATVLGAIALGARIIEKHFTDDNSRVGPDHHFAMNPHTWREMVDASRELELALGDGIKKVEQNEKDTVIIQRRCLRLKQDKKKGDYLSLGDLEALRPSPKGAFQPYELKQLENKKLNKDKEAGDAIYYDDIDDIL